MSRGTDGVWAAPSNSWNPAAAGTTIDPSDWATTLADLVAIANERQIATVVSATSLADDTSAQAIFAAANDTLTLSASTTYRFRASILLATGSTTHTTAFGLGGTATFTGINYLSRATSSAADTLATPQMRRVSSASASVLTATSTAVTTNIELEGIIRINGGGTIIPQVTFSAGPGGTNTVAVDSFFECWPIGSNTIAAVGSWA